MRARLIHCCDLGTAGPDPPYYDGGDDDSGFTAYRRLLWNYGDFYFLELQHRPLDAVFLVLLLVSPSTMSSSI